MRTVIKTLAALLGVTLLAGIGQRVASRRQSLPCPSWLAWLLENPFVDRVEGADLLLDRLDVQPGMRVLDSGCGLDTRFQRLDDGRLTWVGVDLPEVIALRRRLVPDTDRARTIGRSALAAMAAADRQELPRGSVQPRRRSRALTAPDRPLPPRRSRP